MEVAIPLAFTASWASGLNPYLLVFMLGILGRVTSFDVPIGLERVDVLLALGFLVVVDAVADKIMWLDSGWDALNTVIRPAVGALLAVVITTPTVDLPTAFIAAAGGTVALLTHLAKATTRLAVNTSPEPVSNVAVSFTEDAAVASVVMVALFNPWLAGVIALGLFIVGVIVALILASLARGAFRRVQGNVMRRT